MTALGVLLNLLFYIHFGVQWPISQHRLICIFTSMSAWNDDVDAVVCR